MLQPLHYLHELIELVITTGQLLFWPHIWFPILLHCIQMWDSKILVKMTISVVPLTSQLIFLSQCKISLIFAWREKSMTPFQRNTFLFRSSQQLPHLHLRPLKGFLSWHGALWGLSTCLVRCFRNWQSRTQSDVPR